MIRYGVAKRVIGYLCTDETVAAAAITCLIIIQYLLTI